MYIIAFLTIIVMILTNDGLQLGIPIGNFHITIRDIFLFASLVMLLAYRRPRREKSAFIFGPLVLFMFLFFLLYMAYGLAINDLKIVFLHFRQIYFILFYFVFVFLFKEKNRIIKLFKTLNIFFFLLGIETVIVFLYAFYNPVFIRDAFIWVGRVENTVIPRAVVNGSTYFIIFIPMLIADLLQKKHSNLKLNMMVALMSIATLITYTRSIWLGVIFSTILLLFFVKKLKFYNILIFSIILMIIGLTTLLSPLQIAFTQRTTPGEVVETTSVIDRVAQYVASKDVIALHPIIGNGMGKTIYFYFMSRFEWINAAFPDNFILGYLINYGFIGTSILFLIFGIAVSKSLRMAGFIENSSQKIVAYGLISGFIGLLVSSIFTTAMLMATGFFYFAFMLGCIEIMYKKREELKDVNIGY